ncbi:hypothetical protein F4825DRAFT_439832 [Nemania diffusa]|nr:hypothetical protein F4825DRAFT_439832 [Nemania diffusa]
MRIPPPPAHWILLAAQSLGTPNSLGVCLLLLLPSAFPHPSFTVTLPEAATPGFQPLHAASCKSLIQSFLVLVIGFIRGSREIDDDDNERLSDTG